MAIGLAVFAALLIGSADFFGGVAARRGNVNAVALWSQLLGTFAVLAAAVLVIGDPTGRDLLWGTAAGIGSGLGVLFLYVGFTVSRVAVVATVAAVTAAAIPVTAAIIGGERPTATTWLGLALGITAIGLVSYVPGTAAAAGSRIGLLYGLASGLAFGFMVIAYDAAGDDAGLWPVVPARVSAGVLLALLAVVLSKPMLPTRSSWPAVIASGTLAALGLGAFVAATQRAELAAIAVIVGLFPAVTVVLAAVFLHERLRPSQVSGVVAALAAIALIAAG
jgi:uncharacterized membrane protein